VLRIYEVALSIIGETPIIDDEHFTIATKFSNAVTASAINDDIRETVRLQGGDNALLYKTRLRQGAELVPLLSLQNDERDFRLMKEVGKRKPSRPRTDNADARTPISHLAP